MIIFIIFFREFRQSPKKSESASLPALGRARALFCMADPGPDAAGAVVRCRECGH